MKALVPVLLVQSVCALTGGVSGQPSFQGLGDLDGGAVTSTARGVSADGSVVVGYSSSQGGRQAFQWTVEGGLSGLGFYPGVPESAALGVSGDGALIVGSTGSQNPFRWTAASGIEPLSGLNPLSSWVNGASRDGTTIVGGRTVGSVISRAYWWTAAGGPVELSGHPAGSTRSEAFGANADGSVIVGEVTLEFDRIAAFRWTESTGMVVLGEVPGSMYRTARATTPDGAVVVGRQLSGGASSAFRWTQAGGMEFLTGLLGGDALAVSADGSVVVGISDPPTTFGGAFLWTAESGMIDLKAHLVSLGATGLEGWQLDAATGISGDGRVIVGYGHNPAGQIEAWRAVIPAPASVLLFAGLSLFTRRRRATAR